MLAPHDPKPHWYTLVTKPRRERLAQENLERQGFQTYLPELKDKRLRRGREVEVIEALFPRYLFIQLTLWVDNIAPIRSTTGVSTLLRFGGYPMEVPEELVLNLKQHADPVTGLHHRERPRMVRGRQVNILTGPLAGLQGIFEAESGTERVTILLDMLGQQTRVQLQRHQVALA